MPGSTHWEDKKKKKRKRMLNCENSFEAKKKHYL